MKTATIAVAEYVLPKFKVAIESPDHFSRDDGKIQVVIRAKYTHGKPIKGTATASISEVSKFGSVNSGSVFGSKPKINASLSTKTINIDGRGTIEFSIQDEINFYPGEYNRYYNERNYEIKVDVTETLTGLSQSTDKVVTVHRDTYKITSDLKNIVLKPASTVQANVSFVFYVNRNTEWKNHWKKSIRTIISISKFSGNCEKMG